MQPFASSTQAKLAIALVGSSLVPAVQGIICTGLGNVACVDAPECKWDTDINCCVESGECPFVTLDFTNLPNPMANYYGQSSTFRAGDYLYDQLWYTHGIKVSARILDNGHATSSKPFIPRYDRVSGKWKDDKINQDKDDPSSGGAVRLFDTMRPTWSSNPAYHQPLCANRVGEGDPDLGAPNNQCPGGGPGHGSGGEPLVSNGQVNPYANCEPLGMVTIIQEENKDCPDDTGKGGYITLTFREPVTLSLTSLLDIDEGGYSPKLFVHQGGQQSTFNTQPTGDNGLYPVDIDPSIYNNVTMVDVKYWGSGSINSLVYRYCRETPTPEIQILKYAGPPGICSSEGMSDLEPDLYTVPSVSGDWAYCYEISVPESSDECLYDVHMNDPAPIGGLPNHSITHTSESLCPGDTVYVSGSSISGSLAPEGFIQATVVGTGYYSGIQVTDTDDAAVEVYEDIITTAPIPKPTASPTNMPIASPTDMPAASSSANPTAAETLVASTPKCIPDDNLSNPGSQHCPNATGTGVVALNVQGASPSPEDVDIIWNITETGDGSSIQFQVYNPFPVTTRVFVKYHEPAGEAGAWSQACEEHMLEPCGGVVESTLVTANCLKAHGNPVTLIQLYFVDATESLADQIFGPVDIDRCCHPGDIPSTTVAQYSFLIRCACPTAGSRRQLRRVETDEHMMDEDTIVAMFQEGQQ